MESSRSIQRNIKSTMLQFRTAICGLSERLVVKLFGLITLSDEWQVVTTAIWQSKVGILTVIKKLGI
ncbi:MAG: hypothetical protein WA461_07540 [Nitrososphaeraceae archaeon]